MANRHLATGGLALVVAGAFARPAEAQGTIKSPGDHPDYVFEAEPHLSLAYDGGVGPGFRGTVVIADRAFIPSLNNSIGVGAGAEWLFYAHGTGDVLVPIVLQWNFWVHRDISVFGEPGLALHFGHGGRDNFALDPFTIFAGVRFHFSKTVALTIRLGAPEIFHHDNVFSIGVSFLI